MEAGKGSLVVMILVVMLMQGVAADYWTCYNRCVDNRWCGDAGKFDLNICRGVCAVRCTGAVPATAGTIREDTKVYTVNNLCMMECASSLCSNLIGLSNNDVDGHCNRVCSKVCNNRVGNA